ncbi:type III secretion system inner membrane ring subunit SctD [Shewanella sp. 202IG2-18]|uniref:type III secretion system inner membrane ring subunit SctD n=1 Tax=Parashewanella hymeniacidonis TaxID=2807618 RepID=UPI0019621F79|nr:type III secretion system inner membrane ring subunit SctD [Parashewanella hymeniacidonis]MBM7071415.1 type III secretion system inner membrane ring subunit SctD [Parashewanella hymeniacidonis]
MPSNFKILWLNGPLKGRQLVLPQGKFTVGPDGDVLAELESTDLLEFSVEDESVTLETDVEVLIGGEKREGKEALPLSEVIEVDGILFVLGSAAQDIEEPELPKKKGKKKNVSYIALLGISLISTILILMLLIDPVQAPQHEMTPKEWVSEQLTLNELDGIKAIWATNGVVTFNGFCEDSRKLQQFIDGVKSHGILFIEHAECTDQLVTDVKQILTQNGFKGVTVQQNLTPGSVTISGAIQAGDRWDKTVSMLKGINGLVSWQVLNESGAQIKPLIETLRKDKLIQNLMLSQLDDSIVITGEVSQEKQQQIIGLARGTKTIQQTGTKIVFQNIPVRSEVNRILTSSVISYGGSTEAPFVELENGLRLSKGTQLDNGYMVEYIDIDGIDLMKNGQITHVPLLF